MVALWVNGETGSRVLLEEIGYQGHAFGDCILLGLLPLFHFFLCCLSAVKRTVRFCLSLSALTDRDLGYHEPHLFFRCLVTVE